MKSAEDKLSVARPLLTPHQRQYVAWLLTRRAGGDSVESLASTLVDSQVDLNPHQVEAALFACSNLKALPDGQRQLISLVLWKLLASSTHAIAGALETMANRLEGELAAAPDLPDLAQVLDDDYEALDETEEERAEEGDQGDKRGSTTPTSTASQRDAVAQEIAELRHFKALASRIRENAKGSALLTALDRAFAELARLGAARKAILFTESKRTQAYLLTLLEGTAYGDGIVLFNGSNSDARAQAVYKDWLKRHAGTDRITGSRTADSRAARGKYERLLMDLTEAELAGCASFDEQGFVLHRSPEAAPDGVALGRYELPRRSGDSHLYRIGHPLARWIAQQAQGRILGPARLVFDYDAHGTQVSTLKAYRGQTGWLTLKLVSVEALGEQEQHLVAAACTSAGQVLAEDDPAKLLRLPAHELTHTQPAGLFSAPDEVLSADVDARKRALLQGINQRNLGYFDQEVRKLDAWADDLKLGLEQDIKAIDAEIKEVRRTAATSLTLEDKLTHQRRQRELEGRRSKLRRELFARQDEVEAQRNGLIEQLEVQLRQQVDEQTLFTIEWELT